MAFGVFAAVAVASPVAADPAGPTDYRSEVVAVTPPTAGVEAMILGGDSFLQIEAEPGTEVVVIGYQGEPYVWYQPDGTVSENQNAPSKYTNEDRYGGGTIPAFATADAQPDWKSVASGGRWSWHDHRAHWMQESRPLGLAAGDQILEAVIPLVVDGADVDVTVTSTWEPEPSPVPMVLGAIGGVLLALGAWLAHRHRWLDGRLPVAAFTVPVAVLALVAGMWQFTSLPPETGPRPVWWVLPAIAVVCAVVGVVAGVRRRTFLAQATVLLVGVELTIWGLLKRDGLSAAIIPTDAPGWFDRFATAMAITGGVGFAALALWWQFAATRPQSETLVPGTA